MYIKVANFSGFDQVAICPGEFISPGAALKSSRSLLSGFASNPKKDSSFLGSDENPNSFFQGHFYIVDRSDNSHLQVKADGTFSFLPYFPGHFYYLFRGNGEKLKEFSYFDSSEEIRRLLLKQLQTPLVSFNALDVNISEEFVPHLTFCNSENIFEFGESDATAQDILPEILDDLINEVTSPKQEETGSQILPTRTPDELSNDQPEDLSLFCNSLLEELILDVVSRGERCSLCFVTHFPWLKVCRKNNKKKSNKNLVDSKTKMVPKLRGGARTPNMEPRLRGGARTPKFFITSSEQVQNLLTILRSLDVLARLNDHEKCELAEGGNIQSSLCEFCLVRSLNIRGNTLKGRTKIKPVELLGYSEEYINSISLKDAMKFYFNNLFDSAIFLEEKFLTTWDCSVCYSSNASNLYIDFSDPIAQGKDVHYLLSFWDKTFDKEHSEHFNFNVQNRNALVLFFACDFGVAVNLATQLNFQGRQWRCKSVISSTCKVFYHDKQYSPVLDLDWVV